MANIPTSSSSPDSYLLPKRYMVLKVLGEGGYGEVLKCFDCTTKKTVAIKITKGRNQNNEAAVMKVLMDNNLHKKNIIKFYKGFWMNSCLVLEVLDISLSKYLSEKGPLRLQDIRIVIKQVCLQLGGKAVLAIALDALKTIGVIHGDVKTSNIMLVDHVRQPFKVKLIDFGLATFKSKAKQTRTIQTPFFRAPEIMLDMPYSEAIDIWSLGCVMASMLLGFPLFPGRTNYELLQYLIDLLGPPPDSFINAEYAWRIYFIKTDTKQWRLKMPEEHWGATPKDNRCYTFRSLDEMRTMHLEKDNPTEANERRECIELLKAMLKWDEKERITPREVLTHPFITMSCHCSSSPLGSCDEILDSTENEISPCQIESDIYESPEDDTDQAADPGTGQAQTRTKETIMKTHVNESRHGTHRLPSITQPLAFIEVKPAAAAVMRRSPSGLILVQPAPPQKSIPLEQTPDEESISEIDISASTSVYSNAVDDFSNTMDSTDSSQPKKKRRKRRRRRKNRFKCFFCWMKRKFCSCCNADNIKE